MQSTQDTFESRASRLLNILRIFIPQYKFELNSAGAYYQAVLIFRPGESEHFSYFFLKRGDERIQPHNLFYDFLQKATLSENQKRSLQEHCFKECFLP